MGVFYEDRVNDLKIWKRDSLSFMPHFHDSFEIVYMKKGQTRVIINGNEYTLGDNSLCICTPNVIHAYEDDEGSIDAVILFVPRRYAKAFFPTLDKNTVTSPIVHDKDNHFLNRIRTILNYSKQNHNFKEQLLCGYFYIMFAEIFEITGLTDTHRAPPETERRLLSFCLENFRHDISLEQLATELNISKNHISYIFSSKLKVSLPDFIGSLRIKEAKRLIAEGTSMTDAALESGFASIRTFNRRFLSATGMTPREYAKSIATNNDN